MLTNAYDQTPPQVTVRLCDGGGAPSHCRHHNAPLCPKPLEDALLCLNYSVMAESIHAG